MRSLITIIALAATMIGGCTYENHDRHRDPCPPPRAVVYRPAPVVVYREYESHGYHDHGRPDFQRADARGW
jgi:hypothetical protein